MNMISMNAAPKNIAHQAIYDWANNELGNGTIMDIGSELGFGLHHLTSSNRHVIGLDIQLDELIFSKTSKHFHNKNYCHICADGMVIPFSDNSCNGLCMINVLHLVHDLVKVLEECWRILSPQGLLIATIPTDYNLPDEWRIPSEKEYFESILKRAFPSVEFPQEINPLERDSALFQKQTESGLLTAVCRKNLFA
jgi:ubiquinone/menaquinone biosynthesis C-methylase UbiE